MGRRLTKGTLQQNMKFKSDAYFKNANYVKPFLKISMITKDKATTHFKRGLMYQV